MPTLKQLRLEVGLSISQLARDANVDRQTVERAENGAPVRDAKAAVIVRALGAQLGRRISLEEVDGLNIL